MTSVLRPPEKKPNLDLTVDLEASLRAIPVSLNNQYGDSLQPSQWPDTLAKLRKLEEVGHEGPVQIPTKYLITSDQIRQLKRLDLRIVLYIAMTGLQESKIGGNQAYQECYLRASDELSHVVCAIRPVIAGQNDRMPVVEPILAMVCKGQRKLIARGYKDIESSIYAEATPRLSFMDELRSYCTAENILFRERSSCMAAAILELRCPIHSEDLKNPRVDLAELLGYPLVLTDKGIVTLPPAEPNEDRNWTKGDVSFLKMLIGVRPVIADLNPTKVMSLSLSDGTEFTCTSSWFSWTREKKCVVGCWYCHAVGAGSDNLEVCGCNPLKLAEAAKGAKVSVRPRRMFSGRVLQTAR